MTDTYRSTALHTDDPDAVENRIRSLNLDPGDIAAVVVFHRVGGDHPDLNGMDPKETRTGLACEALMNIDADDEAPMIAQTLGELRKLVGAQAAVRTLQDIADALQDKFGPDPKSDTGVSSGG